MKEVNEEELWLEKGYGDFGHQREKCHRNQVQKIEYSTLTT